MSTKRTEIAERFGIPEAPPVTDVDAVVINSGPAALSNKFYSTVFPHGMRLTFAETNPALEAPAFRAAVFLGDCILDKPKPGDYI